MNTPYVYIVILNWKNASDTINCIQSLFTCNYNNKKIFIIDNNSDDGSLDQINAFLQSSEKSHGKVSFYDENSLDSINMDFQVCSDFTLIQNYKNYGFGKGNNPILTKIAEFSKDTLIWLLNNDSVVNSETLSYLVKSIMTDPLIGMSASVNCYYFNNSMMHNLGAKYYPWLGMSKMYKKNQHISILESLDEREIIKRIDYLSGASLLMKSSLLREIGYFDERFFLYSEEQDLIVRAKKANWKITIAKKSFIYHKVSESTKNDKSVYLYMLNKSNAIFLKKHFSIFHLVSSIFFLNLRAMWSYRLKEIIAINKGLFEGLFLHKENLDK